MPPLPSLPAERGPGECRKNVPQGGLLVNECSNNVILKDYINKIEINMYTDFYTKHHILRFAGIEWNINQLENYSRIGNYIVYVSTDKGKALDKMAYLLKIPVSKRNKVLEGGYFD